MSEVAVLVGAVLSPLLALGLLLWLTHLEETLPSDVHAAQRQPPPPPIRTIAVPPPASGRSQPDPAVATRAPVQVEQADLGQASLGQGGLGQAGLGQAGLGQAGLGQAG